MESATVLNSLSDIAIAAVDRRWRYVYANDEACRQLQRDASEIIGKTVLQVISDTEHADWFDQLARSTGVQTASHFEAFVNPLNAWFDFHCYPSSKGLVFTFSNVSQAKREQALKPLPLWNDDIEFLQIVNSIEYTLVDRARCYVLYQLAKLTANLGGDVAEVGVYKGGTARLLARTFNTRAKKQLHLFDTFEGMPSTDAPVDHHRQGDFADTSLESVQRQLRDCGEVRFYKGFFPETAGPIENSRFCLVHVDADIYQSVKDSCAFFYPRLEKGGVMVFDDYGFSSCPGARKAVDEFFSDKEECPFYLPSGQSFIMKRT
jgi:O-methyltransferase